jgi:RimJ/RimL family protein N-acetyltransferase
LRARFDQAFSTLPFGAGISRPSSRALYSEPLGRYAIGRATDAIFICAEVIATKKYKADYVCLRAYPEACIMNYERKQVMFEGQKVRLRAYTKDDLSMARSFLNDSEVSIMMRVGIPFPMRPEDEEKWYNSLDANGDKNYGFAIESKKEGQYLGGCGVHGIDSKNHVATVGIFLGREHIGKGYGTDAMQVLVDFCFNEINLNKVKLFVFAFNKRGLKCYQKVGFKIEGKLRQEIFRQGKYHDMLSMGLLRSEWQKHKKENIDY